MAHIISQHILLANTRYVLQDRFENGAFLLNQEKEMNLWSFFFFFYLGLTTALIHERI